MVRRIAFILLLLISILFFPFFVSALIALFGMFYFSYFWEAVAIFLISDLLYGVPEPKFLNIVIFSTVISFIALILVELLKKKLKFYQEKIT